MKRALSLVLLLVVILFIVQWGFTLFKKEHHIEYKFQVENKEYKVVEDYNKKLSNSYSIIISNDKDNFSYIVDNDYNKQKEIVKKIEVIDKDGTICISPILIDGKSLEIECSKSGVTYSYEAMKNENIVNEFITYLRENNYNQSMWDSESLEGDEVLSITRYKNNLNDNDTVAIWNYKGISIISNKVSDYQSLYSFDKYNNNHGSVVGKYYITPVYKYDSVNDFNELYIINLETTKHIKMKLNETLNQDTFINGVVDNKLYYLDPDNLIQVEIDPVKNEEKIVGTKDSSARYYDGKWNDVNIYDLINDKKTFKLNISDNEIIKKYNPKELLEAKSCYYFVTNDGSYYRLNKVNGTTPVLIFKKNDLKELKVSGNTLYFIEGDTLYYYDNLYGLRRIIKNTEWNYNYTNIYGIYQKSNNE